MSTDHWHSGRENSLWILQCCDSWEAGHTPARAHSQDYWNNRDRLDSMGKIEKEKGRNLKVGGEGMEAGETDEHIQNKILLK